MENYEIVKNIEDFQKRLNDINKIIQFNHLHIEIKTYEEKMNDASFWLDSNQAKSVIKALNIAKAKLEEYQDLQSQLNDLGLLFDFQKQEDIQDTEIDKIIPMIEKKLTQFETELLLSKEYDEADAILEIHPGAGGTESQDWAMMLYRMYRRFSEQEKYDFELIDYQEAEEAGIKSATFIIKGLKAYGKLKSEHGVHRLVRISPFDSNARRHTSFASISVTPVISSDIDLEIKPEDIKVDTFRSSGAGGQSVNTTDSAVRITHIKTGIVVTCQNQRSQIQNRETALQVLKSRIYQVQIEEQEKMIRAIGGESMEIGFGSQIRSYTLHPYALVKDHRTQVESSNPSAVLDGDISLFIDGFLKSKYNR
jgi:peptide chain release factor 2